MPLSWWDWFRYCQKRNGNIYETIVVLTPKRSAKTSLLTEKSQSCMFSNMLFAIIVIYSVFWFAETTYMVKWVSNLPPVRKKCRLTLSTSIYQEGQKLWLSLKPAIFCHFVHMLRVAKSQLGSADTLLYSRRAMPAYICLGMNSSNRSPAKCVEQQRESAWVTFAFRGARVRKGMNL